MTLLWTLLVGTASSANLNGKLLTGGVSHELAGLLLHVLGGAGGLVHSPALLGTLAVTDLLYRFVTFLNGLVESFLFERDGTQFLEVLLADFLLTWFELRDVGVVALLGVLVRALQDGILLQTGHRLLLVHAAEPRLLVRDAASEVDTSDW